MFFWVSKSQRTHQCSLIRSVLIEGCIQCYSYSKGEKNTKSSLKQIINLLFKVFQSPVDDSGPWTVIQQSSLLVLHASLHLNPKAELMKSMQYKCISHSAHCTPFFPLKQVALFHKYCTYSYSIFTLTHLSVCSFSGCKWKLITVQ